MKWYSKLTLERAERVAPLQPPAPSFFKSGRIKRTWDVLFIEYKTLFSVNLLIAAAFLPFLIFLMYISGRVTETIGSFEYALNTGIGYPMTSVENAGKIIELVSSIRRDLIYAFLLLLIPGPFLSGVFSVTRLLGWGHSGVKVFKVFLEGLKKHWWKYAAVYSALIAVLFGVVYFGFYHYENTLNGASAVFGWLIFAALAVAALTAVCFAAYCFVMIPIYDLKFGSVLKNAALYTVGLYPVNMGITLISCLPFFLIFTGNMTVIVITIVIAVFILLSIYALVFDAFCEYGFENFLDKLYEAKASERSKPSSNNGKKKERKKAVNVYNNPKKAAGDGGAKKTVVGADKAASGGNSKNAPNAPKKKK
ncbi:MAG: hypothetical protein LBQ40_05635 [Clostridiales bacterium]|jgi:hypothetical protein|nr:hypothetical protein [Clostridiales bacterium]